MRSSEAGPYVACPDCATRFHGDVDCDTACARCGGAHRIRESVTSQAATSLARQMESAIADLLQELMPGSELDEIRRRCRLTNFHGQPGEFFEVDELPRLYFGPLVFAHENQQERCILRVSREVRRLV